MTTLKTLVRGVDMWTLATTTNILHAVTPDDTVLNFTDTALDAQLCSLVGNPASKHIFLEIYTAQASEIVVASACKNGKAYIGRGRDGTKAVSWPAGACVRVKQIVDAPLIDTESGNPCGCEPSLGALTVYKPLTIDVSDPCNPKLKLDPSGVTAGSYCGLKVDVYGRITSIPSDWPRTCLPAFDPCSESGDGCEECGGGTGSGGTTAASGVSFLPQTGAIIVGTDVQTALEQLEDYVQNNAGTSGTSGVAGLNPTASITATSGPAGIWTIGLSTSGAGAGTYKGFSFDAYGRFTGYVATASGVSIAQGSGVTVNQTSSDAWTISVPSATFSDSGTVTKVNPADIDTGQPINSGSVITYLGLTTWWNKTKNFITGLNSASILSDANSIAVDQAGQTVRATLPDLRKYLGGAHARGFRDNGNVIYTSNVASMTDDGPNGVVVTMAQPLSYAQYQVIATREDGVHSVPIVTRNGMATFTIHWYQSDGVTPLTAQPDAFAFTVFGSN